MVTSSFLLSTEYRSRLDRLMDQYKYPDYLQGVIQKVCVKLAFQMLDLSHHGLPCLLLIQLDQIVKLGEHHIVGIPYDLKLITCFNIQGNIEIPLPDTVKCPGHLVN